MNKQIVTILEENHWNYRCAYVSDSKVIFEKVFNLIKQYGEVVPLIRSDYSIDSKEKLKILFHTTSPVGYPFEHSTIHICTFEQGYSNPYLMIIANTKELIDKFIDHLYPDERKNDQIEDGYFKLKYDGLSRFSSTFVSDDPKFSDLVGLDDIRDTLIKTIDNYFHNLEKFRTMGMNKGINIVLWGSPGLGKTSFVKALARHYRAALFFANSAGSYFAGSKIPELLNPKVTGKCVVLIDDYDGANLSEISQAIFDNGAENMIRIFVTNNFHMLQSSAFISRCRRIFEFKRPSPENLKIYIGKIFDIDPDTTDGLVTEITNFETQRQLKLEQDRIAIEVENEKIKSAALTADEELKLIPLPKDKDPPGFRELNYFLCEFIGDTNPLEEAISKFNDWAIDRSNINPSCSSSSNNANSGSCIIA